MINEKCDVDSASPKNLSNGEFLKYEIVSTHLYRRSAPLDTARITELEAAIEKATRERNELRDALRNQNRAFEQLEAFLSSRADSKEKELRHFLVVQKKATAHFARTLPPERRYGQIEALTIVFAIKKFYKNTLWAALHTFDESQASSWCFSSEKGIPVYTANRLQRWATMLPVYFSTEYQSTTSIGQADALPRLIGSQRTPPEHAVIASIKVEPEINSLLTSTVRTLSVTSAMVCGVRANDPLLRVVRFHRTRWPPACPEF
ncbi:uncharacterized protein DEA37_0010965 [Paragonimus westermani]|uniref:Reverse transcriptase RNase H-like domain-containing protein n=1 Tax=Paragonimus westermani TaxID=34504 RepID=A0A5J4NSH9_9TREM|nr:uncharacterized protein DEA37_0010965 [Paragonimus westermani]